MLNWIQLFLGSKGEHTMYFSWRLFYQMLRDIVRAYFFRKDANTGKT